MTLGLVVDLKNKILKNQKKKKSPRGLSKQCSLGVSHSVVIRCHQETVIQWHDWEGCPWNLLLCKQLLPAGGWELSQGADQCLHGVSLCAMCFSQSGSWIPSRNIQSGSVQRENVQEAKAETARFHWTWPQKSRGIPSATFYWLQTNHHSQPVIKTRFCPHF